MKTMKKSLILITAITSCLSMFSQEIVSGPMLGYNEMREIQVWIQLDSEADVSLEYWTDNGKKLISEKKSTKKDSGFTAHLTISSLEPGTEYFYQVYIDQEKGSNQIYEFKTQELWQWRHNPPDISFAIGSCTYINEEKYDRPGNGYGGNYEIFESIPSKNPDFMLWLGDNVYLREVDWSTKSGFIYRYSHMRSRPEIQGLLSSCHHYAIWDDHDFGPNDADGSFIHKDISLDVFKMFWANNSYGFEEDNSITGQFQYGDLDFFLLDNRTFRTDANIEGIDASILGENQIDWLISSLKKSRSPFKFVCMGGQFLNDQALYENYACFEEERKEILQMINNNNIEGVIFLTGDRHCAGLSELTLENGNAIYDFTVSPLTSKAYDNCDEGNNLLVEGTCYPERNFGMIKATGALNNREITLMIYDRNGDLIWEKTINNEYIIEK